ncbi:MAG: sortase-like acyltransferase [Pedosphaera sp.]|nr:sortase-like acyltransferase [Pedosphaera sp.]
MSHTPLIKIREASSSDVPLILNFIRKKATFDGVPHWVEATEDKLRNELFGAHPTASALFAEANDQAIGIAIYFLTFSSFLARPGIWLDDLYVDENARGQGAGKALLAHLAKLAEERGYGRVEWVTAADNAKGLAFYQRNGACVQDVVRILRLDRAAITQLACNGAA